MNFTPRKVEDNHGAGAINYPSIREYMASNELTLSPEMTINEAIDTILENKITGAPVLDYDRKIVGMLTEKDCLRLIVDGAYNNLPYQDKKVSDYMSSDVKTVFIDSDIFDVANKFLTTNFRKFPVLNDEGRLVGQVSRRDILRATRDVKNTTW